MKFGSSATASRTDLPLASRFVSLALVLSLVLFTDPAVFAQQGWPQSAPAQAAQYSGSPYVQANPNYIANSQYKPSPYRYPQQAGAQQAGPQAGAQQAGPQAGAPQVGAQVQGQYAAPQGQDDPSLQQGYPQQQAYPQQAPQYAQKPYGSGYGGQAYGGQGYGEPAQQQDAQGYAEPGQDYAQPGQDSQAFDAGQQSFATNQDAQQAFAADQLEQLVAPIALYPDNLVAQILAASTYPAQVAAADGWVRSMGYASPDQVASAADGQTSWDPSVKALTAFPQVLDMMNHDLRWTTDLGNAYYNQPQDVLQTIQVMRQRAQAAGTLQNTPQEQVSYNQGYIQLAPANPQVVYVPQYNPWAVYGQPVAPYPGFSLTDAFGAVASVLGVGLRWGAGIGLAGFMHTPFGWAGWALNWLASAIFFNHSPYYSHSTSVAHWGGGRGGIYGGTRMGGINRQPRGFPRPEQGRVEQGRGQGYDRFGSRAGAQAFNRPAARGWEGYSYQHANENVARGYPGSYGRTTLPSYGYGRPQPAMPAREQAYARPGGYGSGFYGSAPRSYASPQQFGRAPAGAYPRNEIAQHAYAEPRSYGGERGFNQAFRQEGLGRQESFGRQERSGGSHFGGGHESFKAPKMPKAPKMSGGGHHGGGGHSGHHGR